MKLINFILRSKDAQDEILQSSHFLCQHSNLLFTLYSMYEEDEKEDNIIVDIIYDYAQYQPLFTCLKSGMIDLNFILSYPINIFIDIYNFLTFLQYDNTINFFTNQRIQQNNNVTSLYIDYIMKYSVELSNIQTGLFLKQEINCVLNYVNKSPLDIQMVHMTTYFFNTYLKQDYDINLLCESIIKSNNIALYNNISFKETCYEYVYLYDNILTNQIKKEYKYKEYITYFNTHYIEKCINAHRYHIFSINIELLKYYIERGVSLNTSTDDEITLLEYLVIYNDINILGYVLSEKINTNYERICMNILYDAIYTSIIYNKYESFKYLFIYIDENIKKIDMNDTTNFLYNFSKYTHTNMPLSYKIMIYGDINILKFLVDNGLTIELCVKNNSLLNFIVMNCLENKNYDTIFTYIFDDYLTTTLKYSFSERKDYINKYCSDALLNLIYEINMCLRNKFFHSSMDKLVNLLVNFMRCGANIIDNNLYENNDATYMCKIYNTITDVECVTKQQATFYFYSIMKKTLLCYANKYSYFREYLLLNGMTFDNDIINDDIDLFDTILKDI